MSRRSTTKKPGSSDIDAALDAMSTDELRRIVHEMLLELDDRAHGRVINRIIDLAARNASDWAPSGPSRDAVSRIVAFAEAAKRAGNEEIPGRPCSSTTTCRTASQT